jgi:hypothetical protein
MTARRLRLRVTTVATPQAEGKPSIVEVPEGAELVAIDDIPTDVPDESNRQVSIQWEGRTLSMFLVDIQQRCEWIQAAIKPRSSARWK